MSIVVFDSQPDSLKKLCDILSKNNYFEVFASSNPDEIIKELNLDAPSKIGIPFSVDLFIIDISDNLKTLKLIEKCKAHNRFRDVPILALASSSIEEQIPIAYGMGATDFIRKPIIELEFISRVRSSIKLSNEMAKRKAREKELIEATNQLMDMNQILTKLALVDTLTQIANRRAFDQTMEIEFKRAKRSRSKLSMLIFDIDFFKQYNDCYGHQAGDETIRKVAQIAQTAIKRPGDLVSRYGGEEFVIILPDTHKEGAEFIAEKLLQAVVGLRIEHERSTVSEFVTTSVGVSTVNFADNFEQLKDLSIEGFIETADQALYNAKKAGRNCIESKVPRENGKSVA